MRAFSTLTSLLALSALLALPGLAHAEKTCSSDSDCAKGWTCHDSGTRDCPVSTCAPGEKCETPQADCTSYKSCQPAPCVADSDCAEGMVCFTYTSSACSQAACAPGQECPTEPECQSKTSSVCAPRYALPCTTASDCGSGFRCESTEQCACSGSGSAPAPSGNGGSASAGSASAPAPEPPSCTCEPSKEKSCHTDPVNCTADSDCLSGWTCATFTSSAPCASSAPEPNPGAGAQGGATPTPAPDCPAPTEIKQCVPPYYELVGDSRGISHDLGSTTSTSGQEASGAAIPPTADTANDGDSTSSAGCSVTQGVAKTSSSLALFGLLGLLSALRRRRAH
ncbi:MAG TPA: hypothetical protein VER11_03070 [Polyangiaceae bacterium]|nr:hypothetical protein [Polyangiaceae bacterium]